jgi:hypothetical protein
MWRTSGNLAAALTSYQASLAIAGRLAKADPGNAGWQRELALSYGRVANIEARQGARETHSVLTSKDGKSLRGFRSSRRTMRRYTTILYGSMGKSPHRGVRPVRKLRLSRATVWYHQSVRGTHLIVQ